MYSLLSSFRVGDSIRFIPQWLHLNFHLCLIAEIDSDSVGPARTPTATTTLTPTTTAEIPTATETNEIMTDEKLKKAKPTFPPTPSSFTDLTYKSRATHIGLVAAAVVLLAVSIYLTLVFCRSRRRRPRPNFYADSHYETSHFGSPSLM